MQRATIIFLILGITWSLVPVPLVEYILGMVFLLAFFGYGIYRDRRKALTDQPEQDPGATPPDEKNN